MGLAVSCLFPGKLHVRKEHCMLDAMLRDSGEQILKLIGGIADRQGPGYTKARVRRENLRAALGDGDEARTKEELRGIFTHISKANYATEEEVQHAARIAVMFPDDLREQITEDAKTHHAEPVKKKRLTIEDLESYLTERHIGVRRNLITHRVVLDGWNQNCEYSKELESEHFSEIIHDDLADGYTESKAEDISRKISVIAGKMGHEFNPVLDLIGVDVWDGKDRLEKLYEILGVTDDLSKLLIRKWMMQALSLQLNSLDNSFGGEGVLVLAGPQGCGKSTFAKKIAELSGEGGFFLPGALLDPQDKDSVMQATSRWIVEIGELGSTFRKADMGRLKAFLTKPYDTYRVPFGREDSTNLRRTSFIATVDSADFLTDDSGNRRWWVIEVEKIDLDALDKLDVVQLWRQIQRIIDKEGVQAFRLTRKERDELNQRNTEHEKMIPAEQEIRDILAQYRGDIPKTYKFGEAKRMSASQIADAYTLRYSSQQIGRALTKIGVEGGRTHGSTWYIFPDRAYNSPSVHDRNG